MQRQATQRVDHNGSSFDSFLEEQGILQEADAAALRRVAAWQLTEAEKQRKPAQQPDDSGLSR